jgi:hypothetical protein
MWILADWLKKYDPIVRIQDGAPVLRGVRILSSDTDRPYLLLGYARDFFDPSFPGLICVNGHDSLILKSEDIDEVFNDILNAFDTYNDWSERLQQLLHENCPLQSLLDASLPIFDDSLSISDSSYMNTVFSFRNNDDEIARFIAEHHRMPENLILASYEQAAQRQAEPHAFRMDMPSIPSQIGCRNLFYDHQHVGWLTLICKKHPLTEDRLQLLDVLGDAVSQWLLQGENHRCFFGKALLFQQLIAKQPVDAKLLSQTMAAMDWQPEDVKYLYAIRFQNSDEAPVPLINVIGGRLERCVLFPWENRLVLLLDGRLLPPEQTEPALRQILRRFHALCGKSFPLTDLEKLAAAYQQAATALQYGDMEDGAIYACDDCGLLCLKDVLQKNAPPQIVHPALRQLQAYDARHRTELFHTLHVFLLQERNQYHSAEVLHIHRNTLLYRIQKIRDLTGVDLDCPDVRLYLLLSYLTDPQRLS